MKRHDTQLIKAMLAWILAFESSRASLPVSAVIWFVLGAVWGFEAAVAWFAPKDAP